MSNVKPTLARMLRSTADVRQANKELNQEDKMGYKNAPTAPEVPQYLDEHGSRIYLELHSLLGKVNLIKETDTVMLAALADAMSEYQRFTGIIRDEGDIIAAHNGVAMPHPLHSRKDAAFNRILKLSNKFGLTPGDRASLMRSIAEAEGTSGDARNPFEGRL